MIAPDMATMLSFVVTDAPIAAPVLQALLSKGVTAKLQRHHRRQRHLDLRHAPAVRHRQGAGRRAGHEPPRPPARRLPRGAGRPPPRSRPSGGAGRRGRAQVRRGAGERRGLEGARPSASRCRSPTRRWSRPRSPARTPTGAAIVMAVGKAGEPADRDRLAISFGDIRVAREGRARPGLFRGGDLGLHEERGDRHPVDIGLGKGSDRSGPATSPRSMSRSTATTGAETREERARSRRRLGGDQAFDLRRCASRAGGFSRREDRGGCPYRSRHSP